jgi:hypothetical protein
VERSSEAWNGEAEVVVDYKTTLRRLALRDDRYIESLLADERESAAISKIDPRSHALVRVGARSRPQARRGSRRRRSWER